MTSCSTIKYWLENEVEPENDSEMTDPSERPISYIKISFLWAMYHLKRNSSLNEALKDILKRGGDTCANGAIVGGLVGAACGLNVIDESKIEYVLDNKENAADNEAVPSNYNKYSPGKVVSRFKQE